MPALKPQNVEFFQTLSDLLGESGGALAKRLRKESHERFCVLVCNEDSSK